MSIRKFEYRDFTEKDRKKLEDFVSQTIHSFLSNDQVVIESFYYLVERLSKKYYWSGKSWLTY